MPYLILIILAVLLLYVIGVYNGLVTTKTRIAASIQEIGNQLKRQAELIPNLEESAKGYLKQEKDVFKMLTDARKSVSDAVASGDLNQLSQAGDQVTKLLPKLQVVVESNPELKSAGVVTDLMDELRDTSDKVMYARRTLIDLTADYNIKISTFPSNIVANMFNFKIAPGLAMPNDSGAALQVSDRDVITPKVKL
jgi:LemA protein